MADPLLPTTRFDAHTFQGAEDAAKDAVCSYCSFPRASIIHHPSRIKATMAIVRRARDEEAEAS